MDWSILIPLVGTAIGTFAGIIAANKLTNYRIEQLELKVDKHNNLIARTYELEKKFELHEHDLNEICKKLQEMRNDAI